MLDLSDYRPETDLRLAATLPARWYRDPAFLAAERERIFARSWQYVGSTHWVRRPGDHFSIDLQGEPLVIVRGKDDRIRALSNVCRHRAGPVAEGRGCSPSLQCRYHGWTYSLDGILRGTPEFDGVKNWDKEKARLPEFRLDTWGPLLFVCLDPEAPPLSDFLEGIPDETRRLGVDPGHYRFLYRRDYVVRCNWKVYVDNYLEGYHIPIAHPALYKELEYARYEVETSRLSCRHKAPVRSVAATDALYYWVFPNLMINVYPDNLSVNLVVPLSPDETLTVFEWFVAQDSPLGRDLPEPPYRPLSSPHLPSDEKPLPEDVARLVSFSHQVQLEDIYLCEAVHKGLGSRTYRQGRFSVKRENGVHFFHRLVHRYLS